MSVDYPRMCDMLLFELALQAAATAEGLHRSCRRRSCRAAGRCALCHDRHTEAVSYGCAVSHATALRAGEYLEFLHLLGKVDPDGEMYNEVRIPHPEDAPQPGSGPEPWAQVIMKAYGIAGR